MAKKHHKAKNILHYKIHLLPTLLLILLISLSIYTYQVFLSDKYLPFTFVGDTNISFLTEGQAIHKIESSFQKRKEGKLELTGAGGSLTIDLATASASIDYTALEETFKNQTQGTVGEQVMTQLQILFLRRVISPRVNLSLERQLANLAESVDKEPQNAKLYFNGVTTPEGSPSANIQVEEGIDGLSLDKVSIEKEASKFLLTGKYTSTLPIKIISPKLTTKAVLQAKDILESSIKNPVKLEFEQKSWLLDAKELLTLLYLTGGQALLDKEKTFAFLQSIAQEIDQEVAEGLFEFNPATGRVSSFKPSQEGRKLDLDKTFTLLNENLKNSGSKTIALPVYRTLPKIQTSDVNSLGIKELLGRGVSNFAGSIQNRIYNVNLTATKLNGVLIPPGEIFSFNKTVGDITAATGFRKAYVIKEGRTVLDDGGGVCQDSTTVFRAVLNAGLPVVKRTAHAYRVSYYEQGFPPGLDATVFYPSVDFQFKNNTPAHILIQAHTEGLTLYVDLYGTSDGRISTISKSTVTNQTPPPPELRQDDPTLPKGEVKQVDWSAWGANVSFSRTVTRNGETLIQETFKSNYKPWQAVYLVGTRE